MPDVPPIPPPAPNPTPARDPGQARALGGPAPNPQPGPGGGAPGLPEDLAQSAERAAGEMESAAGAAADLAAALARVPPAPAAPPAPPPAPPLPPPVGLPPSIPSWDAYKRFEAQRAARMPEAQARSAAQRLTEETQVREKGLRAEALNRALYGPVPGAVPAPPPPAPVPPAPAPTTQRVLPATPPAGMPPPPPGPPARDFAGAPAVVTHSPEQDRAYAQAEAAWEQARQAKIAAEDAARAQGMGGRVGGPGVYGRAPLPPWGPLPAPADRPLVAGPAFQTNVQYTPFQQRLNALRDAATDAGGALAKLPRAILPVAAAFYAAERAVAKGNPLVSGTFSASAELLQARVGRDIAPIFADLSSGLQGLSDVYQKIPRPMREMGWTVAASLPLAAYKMLGGTVPKPELSYKDLPQPQIMGGAEFSAQLSLGSLGQGPLDTRIREEKMRAVMESLGGGMGDLGRTLADLGSNFFPNFGR